jgi:uncharacterized protein (TIGR00255 family)
MTGHGRGAAEAAGRRFSVEARSVNHRFLDLKLRAGGLDARAEEAVQQAVRRRVERGALTLTIREDGGAGRHPVRVDVDAARQVHGALEGLRHALGYVEPVPLDLVLAQPGVLVPADAEGQDAALPGLLAAVDAALVELGGMRRREGAALAADLLDRIGRLGGLADAIAAHAAEVPAELRRRLEERIGKLLADRAPPVAIDENRLAAEVALYADRADVTEELVRLRAHLESLRAAIAEDAAVGRRLDFLVQEVGRELNTIGSKSQSVDITRRVVDAKAELEKIREQVQNVE